MPARKTAAKTPPKTDYVPMTPTTSSPSLLPQTPSSNQTLLTILLLISVFANGILWTKVQAFEKGGAPTAATTTAPTAINPLSVDNLKLYAKEVGLNTSKFNSCVDKHETKDSVAADLTQGTSLGVNGTPAFFINGKFIGGAFPLEAFKDVIDKELAGKGSKNYKDYSAMLQQAYEQGKSFDPVPKTVDIDNAQTKGDKNAPVIMVEFSDFQCPFCARFFSQTEGALFSEYVDKGKVLFIYKQFPLTQIHPFAQGAAEASLCAGEQGKFWEYHERLFKSQSQGN